MFFPVELGRIACLEETSQRGSNLTLTARGARGIAVPPWDFIVGVKEKASEGDLIHPLVRRVGFCPAETASNP